MLSFFTNIPHDITQIHRQHLKLKLLLPWSIFNNPRICYDPYNCRHKQNQSNFAPRKVQPRRISNHIHLGTFSPFKSRAQLLKSNSKIHERLIKLKTENLVRSTERNMLDLVRDFKAHLNWISPLKNKYEMYCLFSKRNK